MKKSFHKNGVTVSEFDNKKSFDFKKGSAGKHQGDYPSSPAVAGAPSAKKHAKGRGQKRKARLSAILAKKKA